MPPDILWYAFGDGFGSVDQDIEITKKQYEWTAAEDPEPGRHIYRIKAFLREPRATVPRYDIKIDADQGFLITEFFDEHAEWRSAYSAYDFDGADRGRGDCVPGSHQDRVLRRFKSNEGEGASMHRADPNPQGDILD